MDTGTEKWLTPSVWWVGQAAIKSRTLFLCCVVGLMTDRQTVGQCVGWCGWENTQPVWSEYVFEYSVLVLFTSAYSSTGMYILLTLTECCRCLLCASVRACVRTCAGRSVGATDATNTFEGGAAQVHSGVGSYHAAAGVVIVDDVAGLVCRRH